MTKELKEATDKYIKAREDFGALAIKMLDAQSEILAARNEVIANDAQYATLTSDSKRQAYMNVKLATMLDDINKLELDKAIIQTNMDVADAQIRCAKYCILAEVGKVVE